MTKILVLGGYGNFGKRICQALSDAGFSVIVAGRNRERCLHLAQTLNAQYSIFDVETQLVEYLDRLKPKIVINTCGPFQNQDYRVAKQCIEKGIHYIDIADGREFVCGISQLNLAAKEKNVLVVSGASTVPALSSAVIDHFKDEYLHIDSLIYGISPGQKTERGLATTRSILSYLGKKLKPTLGKCRYGWQDIYRQYYPGIGHRWMGNCDIPDLDLFPQKYHLKSMQFSAGMESSSLHFGIWMLSWLVRMGLPVKLESYAQSLLTLSHYFDQFGTANGGMHVLIKGKNKLGHLHTREWFLIAKEGDGPQVPCAAAIILAKRIGEGRMDLTGAFPCIEMITLEEYLEELSQYNIKTIRG